MFINQVSYGLRKLAIGILIVLSVPCLTFAFKNEPDGFRGIQWGTTIDTLSEFVLTGDTHTYTRLYIKKNDKKTLGYADLSAITYITYKQQFCSVMISFSELDNFLKIKDTFFNLYGYGDRNSQSVEGYIWIGSKVVITLDYNKLEDNGVISYHYWPIATQIQSDKRVQVPKGSDKKDQVTKGKEDL